MRVLVKLVVLTFALGATVKPHPRPRFRWLLLGTGGDRAHLRRRQSVLRPIVKILALPVIILTLGIGALFVNGLLFWLVVWLAEPGQLDLGLTSNGFWPAFFGAIVMSIITWGPGALPRPGLSESRTPPATRRR